MRLTQLGDQIKSAGRSSPYEESAMRRSLYFDVNTIHKAMALCYYLSLRFNRETKDHAVPNTVPFFEFLAAVCANHLIQWLLHSECLRYHALPT